MNDFSSFRLHTNDRKKVLILLYIENISLFHDSYDNYLIVTFVEIIGNQYLLKVNIWKLNLF